MRIRRLKYERAYAAEYAAAAANCAVRMGGFRAYSAVYAAEYIQYRSVRAFRYRRRTIRRNAATYGSVSA